ncbi:hypothetical protein [Mycobacterium leprae]|uniref:hypothetical protein n=1 Tax=Mycobacterium leprae TaxID=1769 RepID=UPI0002FB31E9|nr:hypothetical protein [Mycobacterium leprae]
MPTSTALSLRATWKYVDHFDATGIALESGGHLDAEVIITAAGLQLQVFDGVAIRLDSINM